MFANESPVECAWPLSLRGGKKRRGLHRFQERCSCEAIWHITVHVLSVDWFDDRSAKRISTVRSVRRVSVKSVRKISPRKIASRNSPGLSMVKLDTGCRAAQHWQHLCAARRSVKSRMCAASATTAHIDAMLMGHHLKRNTRRAPASSLEVARVSRRITWPVTSGNCAPKCQVCALATLSLHSDRPVVTF